jgi:DNA-binding XRE family transcriptional regulator
MGDPMQDQATAAVAEAVNGGRPIGEEDWESIGPDPVSVISAAIVKLARAGCGESREQFAARAGVSADTVAGVEDGRYPAWALAYPVYVAIEAAAGAVDPGLSAAFDVGAACDLLLTAVLGRHEMISGEPLWDPERCQLGRALLRWAMTGKLPVVGYVTVPDTAPLLSQARLSQLRDCAADLSAGRLAPGSSAARWLGAELLALSGPSRPVVQCPQCGTLTSGGLPHC